MIVLRNKMYTVMVKNIGTPALLSDNAPLLPENCCNYKCFGIHMFIYFVCIGKTQKNWEKIKICYHSTFQIKKEHQLGHINHHNLWAATIWHNHINRHNLGLLGSPGKIIQYMLSQYGWIILNGWIIYLTRPFEGMGRHFVLVGLQKMRSIME